VAACVISSLLVYVWRTVRNRKKKVFLVVVLGGGVFVTILTVTACCNQGNKLHKNAKYSSSF
jgi:hypothetical protein